MNITKEKCVIGVTYTRSKLSVFCVKTFNSCHCRLSTAGDVIQLRDIKDFGVKFWLICVICVTYYVTVFPFISLAL